MSSFFHGGSFMGGGRAAAPADPGAEVQRLLNSQAQLWMTQERELKETKAKREQVDEAYYKALEERQAATDQLYSASSSLAEAEAVRDHLAAQLEAKQAVNKQLMDQVDAAKCEVDGLSKLLEQARSTFLAQLEQIQSELGELRANHPESFMLAASG